jgi:GNAT superfamily N-acetyltransferase
MIAGLRLAVPSDLAAVQALVAQAYGPYVAEIGVRPGPMDEDYAALIARGQVQVVERGAGVVALLVLIPETDALLLENVAVSPAARGEGLGQALLALADAQARAAGYRVIRLYTHERMLRNQAIYVRWGYVETRRAVEQGLARVFMEKTLD